MSDTNTIAKVPSFVDEPPPVDLMAEAQDRLAIIPPGAKGVRLRNDSVIDRIEKSTGRVRVILERVAGPRQRVVPSGDKRIGRLIDDLDREIQALEELL